MGLQEDAKKLLPFIQAAAEGKTLARKSDGDQALGFDRFFVLLKDRRAEPIENMNIIEPPRLRPWNSIDEIPVDHWFNLNHDITPLAPIRINGIRVDPLRLVFISNTHPEEKHECVWDMESLFKFCRHSSDLKNWEVCGVEIKDGE